ncbi:unnamed protein product [Larinioides sclopetarius]|uniref:Uncharacterized protein n=1 Tax=Larinioides sclopetarius TaxID=280406 RepID=A0AAV1ZXK8_9ARAC
MGFLKSTSTTRCRYVACFALGFVAASLLLAVMFWIIWCYMGLTIVQVSDTQRRAVVNYSYTTSKPPTTSNPTNRTEGAIEGSLNAISKSPVTPPTQPRKRSDSSTDLAKGDFASRSLGGASQNSTRRESVTSSHERKASILHIGEDDVLHPRKVSTSNTENRSPEAIPKEIKPTQTYAPAQSDPLPTAPKEERRPISRDSDRKDEVQSSRPSYRDPEFEREPPPRRSEPGRRRYDDDDDYYDRGSPSRYDKRDRGRDTDDRYSKGDTRVYPDERPRLDDKYPPRDSDKRRGDDRDREDRYRDRDYDDRYRDRKDRPRDYDDRYRDRDDRPRDYDDRYRVREDRPRDYDERYRDHDRPYLDDDRNRKREDRYDDRYLSRDDRYISKYPDDDDRSRERPYYDRRDRVATRDDEDRYIPARDRDYREPIMSSRADIPLDRKSGRPDDVRRPSDYDTPIRDKPRTPYNDESRTLDRYPIRGDEYLRPSKYDDRDTISPSRTREEANTPRSTVPLSRSRDDAYKSGSSKIEGRRRDDDRYPSNRDRSRYYGDGNRREDESRYISPSSVREADIISRDDYPTRSSDDRKLDEVALERRSYSAEEEEEYRRQNPRTRYYDDVDRKPSEDSRRGFRTEDDYPRRRTDDDEYRRSRPRGDYDTDSTRSSDRYDGPIDDDVRPSRRYLPEYDEPRRRTDPDVGLRKESYPRDVIDEDRSSLRRPEGRPSAKDRRYDEDIPPRRAIYDDISDDRPLRPAVDTVTEEGRRRYKDDAPLAPDDSPRRVPLRSEKRELFSGSETSPRDVVVREKRYHNSRRPFDDSRIEERPINAKDVIEAALKHPDAPNSNPREVIYPVYDPRSSNLTATDSIPLSDRRGTTITSRRRRSRRAY